MQTASGTASCPSGGLNLDDLDRHDSRQYVLDDVAIGIGLRLLCLLSDGRTDEEDEQDQGEQADADQRRQAMARQHSVVDLQHVERAGEVEHVQQGAEQRHADEGRPERSERA